jgi:hypothetical protein
MARHPASDERSVLPPPTKATKGERFYVKELALFLRVAPRRVLVFLRDQSMLRWTHPGPSRRRVNWTTARGVGLCIAHFRHIQGDTRVRIGNKY